MLLRTLAQTPINKRCLQISRQITRQGFSDGFRGYLSCTDTRKKLKNKIVERVNDDGDTRLHIAAKKDQELVKIIIERADPSRVVLMMNVKNYHGIRAIDLVPQPLKDRVNKLDEELGFEPFRRLYRLKYKGLTCAPDAKNIAVNFMLKVYEGAYKCDPHHVSLLGYALYLGMGSNDAKTYEENIVIALENNGFKAKGLDLLKPLSQTKKNKAIVTTGSLELSGDYFAADASTIEKVSDN